MYITYDEVADGGLENTKTIVKLEVRISSRLEDTVRMTVLV